MIGIHGDSLIPPHVAAIGVAMGVLSGVIVEAVVVGMGTLSRIALVAAGAVVEGTGSSTLRAKEKVY